MSNKVSLKEFEKIRALLVDGWNQETVTKRSRRDIRTVRRIAEAISYKNYKVNLAVERYEKQVGLRVAEALSPSHREIRNRIIARFVTAVLYVVCFALLVLWIWSVSQ